ncbi:sulfite exporter TauE/SafE family protein [Sphaerotilus sp.]|uniref:sulfite exporter TauE/SafE family protein n=1 Tax=Sphaerotilus sp. TaxID=2093942 RepID=UPI002ACDE4BE|nr:sulfite exporter TauE/SafE family protein [Sphaerotilus sp.]MDZ7856020.1 sulfite exporter TauE/SafE family protein [Sphaerotilus sp.]
MKIRDLDLSDNPINAEHQALGLPPVENALTHSADHPVLRFAMWSVVFLLMGVTIYLGTRLFNQPDGHTGFQIIAQTLESRAFWNAVAVGLLAQTVDGALGMAYGITSTSFLLATGSSPAVASAAVHIAEVFTTGVSGITHIKLGNVNKNLFLRLLVPGIIGASTGAWIVSSVDGNAIKPFIAAYLLVMGLYVISKIFRKIRTRHEEPRHVAKLGLLGGFVDAIGGGGWGPVVTTTLVGTGHDPRMTIGSVNLAEFFLTFVSAGVFAMLVGESPWPTVAGLVIGGLFAAPLAAMLTKRLHTKALLALVGTVISLISLYNLYQALQ